MTTQQTPRWQQVSNNATNAIDALTKNQTNTTGESVPAILRDPGPRAVLARSLRHPPDNPISWRAQRFLSAYLPSKPTVAEERAFLTICATVCAQSTAGRADDMDAAEHSVSQNGSLGTSMAYAVVRKHMTKDPPAESRLILLGRQNLDGIHRMLPRTLLQLRSEGVCAPVDWARLISDLATWPYQRRVTAKRWIQDYHRTRIRLETKLHASSPDNSESDAT